MIETPPLDKGNYHIFFRYDLKIPDGGDTNPVHALFYLSGQDKYILQYLRFKLYNRNQDDVIQN